MKDIHYRTHQKQTLRTWEGRVSVKNDKKLKLRSMEFEHPVFVQQAPATNKSRAAVPYHLKQTDVEFGRTVADSMPELSRDRSYPVIYIIIRLYSKLK